MLMYTFCVVLIVAAPVHPFPKRNFWGRRNNHDSGIDTPFKKRDHADHPPIRPSQVSVQFFDQSNGWGSVCGGAIIGNYQVLTTARCLKFLDNRPARVVAGTYDLASPLPTTQFPEVAKVIPYKNDNRTFKNDIALLVLKKPFVFNENVQPAVIDLSDTFYLHDCEFAGWDSSLPEPRPLISSKLRIEKNITILSNEVCQPLVSLDLRRKVCGKVGRFFEEPCGSQTGNPLICGKRHNILVGLQSILFCFTDLPVVFTKVGSYIDWIKHQQPHLFKF
ncbi:hypothetical protein Btru_033818 [Bulinus truncatus]|nr:hypothetical protein Btru_033818 [Bulinus truncatus]